MGFWPFRRERERERERESVRESLSNGLQPRSDGLYTKTERERERESESVCAIFGQLTMTTRHSWKIPTEDLPAGLAPMSREDSWVFT